MVIFETPCVEISYVFHVNCLYINWLCSPDNATFVEAHSVALQFSIDNPVVRSYCTDLTSIGSLSRDQEAWLSHEYYQKSYNKLKSDFFVAVIFSEEHFKAVVTNYQIPSALSPHPYVYFNYFTLKQEALHWLESIEKGQDLAFLSTVS